MAIKFGFGQKGQPTPESVSRRMDLYVKILGVIVAFLSSAKFVPTWISDITTPVIAALVIPIILELKKFYGYETERKRVDISDVAVIDDKKMEDSKK